MEKMEQEIKDIKEFLLINIMGIYHSKDVNEDFKAVLDANRKYISTHKELLDRKPSNSIE